MKLATALKKVVEFLENNPASTKEDVGTKTKVKGIELTNVLKALRKDDRLVEEGEGKEVKLSVKPAPVITETEAAETPAEENTTAKKSRGRNTDKFQFNGNTFGKGPLVREVVRQYVAGHPKTTYPQLKKVFEDSLLRRFGIFQDIDTARSLSGARDRYFMKDEHQIKLADKKIIVVCSQFTSDNIQPFLKAAKTLGFKIK